MSQPAPQPSDHPAVPRGRLGVLLINLGTPEAPTAAAVRRYLREFLSDRRIIETSPLVWQPILNLFILPFRPQRTAAAYRLIWRADADGSPLRHFTRLQAEGLGRGMSGLHAGVVVDWAMRYGTPSVAERLESLRRAGCDRILAFALYPQYSGTTTASAYDAVFRALEAMRWQPALRTAPPFHDHPAYVGALAGTVRDHLSALPWAPEAVVASYHGIPKRYFDAGDPYYCHCAKTTRLLGEALGWAEGSLRMTFQSRFGPMEWLQPYTDETLKALPAEGVRRVAVLSPAFLADCLETLEEMAERGRETFLAAGGEEFTYIPCLNDAPAAIDLLEVLVRRELGGWL
ncbi:MAG: ferrochelatase [Alphaproteobacteria bacterium]|nr:ferrochelatase [Alphaproteobacteria bacterium]